MPPLVRALKDRENALATVASRRRAACDNPNHRERHGAIDESMVGGSREDRRLPATARAERSDFRADLDRFFVGRHRVTATRRFSIVTTGRGESLRSSVRHARRCVTLQRAGPFLTLRRDARLERRVGAWASAVTLCAAAPWRSSALSRRNGNAAVHAVSAHLAFCTA
jgi:hypothetical protein